MQHIASHTILVAADSYENGCTQVLDFFDATLLVKYDRIDIDDAKSCQAADPSFHQSLDHALQSNRDSLNRFIAELEKTGFSTSSDFMDIQPGYPSKLLHIITHIIDGFIGIDSTLYNLIEDSHWVSDQTTQMMKDRPEDFWLIHLDCFSTTPEKAAIVQQ